MSRTVTQAIYDDREEETDRVARKACSEVAEPVEVNLWVLECSADPGPGELFVSSSVVIMFESCENVFSLFGSEKLCSCGVVMDEEVRSNGYDDSQQTLLE